MGKERIHKGKFQQNFKFWCDYKNFFKNKRY